MNTQNVNTAAQKSSERCDLNDFETCRVGRFLVRFYAPSSDGAMQGNCSYICNASSEWDAAFQFGQHCKNAHYDIYSVIEKEPVQVVALSSTNYRFVPLSSRCWRCLDTGFVVIVTADGAIYDEIMQPLNPYGTLTPIF